MKKKKFRIVVSQNQATGNGLNLDYEICSYFNMEAL